MYVKGIKAFDTKPCNVLCGLCYGHEVPAAAPKSIYGTVNIVVDERKVSNQESMISWSECRYVRVTCSCYCDTYNFNCTHNVYKCSNLIKDINITWPIGIYMHTSISPF